MISAPNNVVRITDFLVAQSRHPLVDVVCYITYLFLDGTQEKLFSDLVPEEAVHLLSRL